MGRLNGFISMEELFKEAEEIEKKILMNPVWGEWKLNKKTMCLEHRMYEIDLEDRCNTSAQILDWIFQILGKNWANPNTIYDLCQAFNFIFRVQEMFCSFGQEQHPSKEKLKECLNKFMEGEEYGRLDKKCGRDLGTKNKKRPRYVIPSNWQ